MQTTVDSQKLDELESLLRELADLQRRLVEAAEAKKDAMRCLDRDRIQQATETEQTLIERLGRVEAARQQLVSSLSSGAATGPGSLEKLGEMVDEPRRHRLVGLRRQIVELARATQRVNAVNRFVSRHCLEHFQTLLQVLTLGGRPAPVYTADGAVRPMGGGCLLDRTV